MKIRIILALIIAIHVRTCVSARVDTPWASPHNSPQTGRSPIDSPNQSPPHSPRLPPSDANPISASDDDHLVATGDDTKPVFEPIISPFLAMSRQPFSDDDHDTTKPSFSAFGAMSQQPFSTDAQELFAADVPQPLARTKSYQSFDSKHARGKSYLKEARAPLERAERYESLDTEDSQEPLRRPERRKSLGPKEAAQPPRRTERRQSLTPKLEGSTPPVLNQYRRDSFNSEDEPPEFVDVGDDVYRADSLPKKNTIPPDRKAPEPQYTHFSHYRPTMAAEYFQDRRRELKNRFLAESEELLHAIDDRFNLNPRNYEEILEFYGGDYFQMMMGSAYFCYRSIAHQGLRRMFAAQDRDEAEDRYMVEQMLLRTAMGGCTLIAELVLQIGADPDVKEERTGLTAISISHLFSNPQVGDLIDEYRTKRGRPPIVSKYRDDELEKMLRMYRDVLPGSPLTYLKFPVERIYYKICPDAKDYEQGFLRGTANDRLVCFLYYLRDKHDIRQGVLDHALVLASNVRDIEMVDHLLRRGANMKTNDDEPVLNAFAPIGSPKHLAMLKLFENRGFNFTARPRRWNAYAILSRYIPILKHVMTWGLPRDPMVVQAIIDEVEHSPLDAASYFSKKDMVRGHLWESENKHLHITFFFYLHYYQNTDYNWWIAKTISEREVEGFKFFHYFAKIAITMSDGFRIDGVPRRVPMTNSEILEYLFSVYEAIRSRDDPDQLEAYAEYNKVIVKYLLDIDKDLTEIDVVYIAKKCKVDAFPFLPRK